MSIKRATLVINRSVLGQAPFSVSITVVGITIIMLFTAIEPEASAGLGFWERLLFWTTQISISLAGILVASLIIRRLASLTTSNILLVIITGAIASIFVSPAFVLVENLFPNLNRVPDSVLDEFAETGFMSALIVQTVETMPALIIIWVLVNLPILLNSAVLNSKNIVSHLDTEPPREPSPEKKSHTPNRVNDQQSNQDIFLQKLPENVGKKIMYVSSDLHYLNVTTEIGKALILGSINKFAEAFDEQGFLIHRSHWVNKAYVSRVFISGSSANCVMQDKRSIPISRSKRKLLKAYFGNNNAVKIDVVKKNSQ